VDVEFKCDHEHCFSYQVGWEVKMKLKKRLVIGLLALFALLITPALAMLNVQISNVGSVVGQTKELTISANAGVVTGAALFGTQVTLPACSTALASSFADIATATLSWGTSLQSNTDYELFFCLGNIGANAGVVHVTTTGQATGETEVFEQAQSATLGGLTFSPCDGATIAGGGVIAVRGHLHTPTVGLNGVVSLTGKTTFTFS
jgi:hypothetical protein